MRNLFTAPLRVNRIGEAASNKYDAVIESTLAEHRADVESLCSVNVSVHTDFEDGERAIVFFNGRQFLFEVQCATW